MSNNHDILNRRDRSLEQPALSSSIGKLRKQPSNVSVSNRFGLSGFYSAVPFVFRIVIVLLLLVAVTRVVTASPNTLTFTGFLQALRNAPSVDLSGVRVFTDSAASLREIPLIGGGLAFLANICGVAAYAALGVIQIVQYIVYFIGFVFV